MTDILTTLASGDVNLFTGLIWLLIATGFSVIGVQLAAYF